ncbi:MAG: PAS domain S-box protein [Vicinamibacterales bacterium]
MDPITTILIVDSCEDERASTARTLLQAGYLVMHAADGVAAMRQIRELRPGLVLLSVALPDLAGMDVLQQVRSDPSLADISVVLVGPGLPGADQQAEGLPEGADGYIVTPIAGAELIGRLRLHLRQRHLAGELRASEERFRGTFEQAAVGIAHVGTDGRFLRVNERLCEILGHPRDELLGIPFVDLTVAEDRDASTEARSALLSGVRSSYTAEKRYLRKDGAAIWVNIVTTLERPASGPPRYFITVIEDITARKLTEQSLREQAGLLRIAGRAARLGAWTIDLPERRLTWSDETCAIHDLPPGHQPTLDEGVSYYRPEDLPQVMAFIDACAQAGTPYDFELPKITAKGRRIWVRSIGEAVRDQTGAIIRLQGAFQDISEQRRVEEGLRQSAAQLAVSNRALQMLSACNEAITRAAGEQELLARICSLAVEIGGYRMAWVGHASDNLARSIVPLAHAGEELGYLASIDLSWSEDDTTGNGPAGRAIRSGQAVVVADLADEPGFFHWREEARKRGYRGVICLPLRDEDKTFGLLVLYSSEAKHIGQDELTLLQGLADNLALGIKNIRAQAERARMTTTVREQASLLDKAQDAIIVRDLEHRILYWNRSAARLHGWSAMEVIGRREDELLYRDPAPFRAALAETMAGGEWVGELDQTSRDGRTLTVESRWTLVRDDDGSPRSILVINTDITQRRHLEQQYLRAQRMESIGTLAGGIAHDLNNALAPILMSIELLQGNLGDDERGEILATIETSAKRGAAMVKQVLSFARGMEGRRVEVRLQPLIREVSRMARDTFPKNILIEERVSSDLWGLEADPTQLNQVLVNLGVNARDAMPSGGRITVTAENIVLDEEYAAMNIEARAGRYVKIDVADTGAGIPKNIIDRIFEPFFTTKATGQGTGLGLATSLAIVKSHGGFIRVSSEPGVGTRFTLYLPALSRVVAAPVAPASVSLPRGNGEMVLVVDDEAAIRQLTRQTLEAFGYQVLVAADGSEAVAVYARRGAEIAVVLTDMMMPVLDGAATIEVLRRLNPQVQIIGASGLTAGGNQACGSAPLAGFLPKPFTAETLLKAVRAAVDG